MAAHSGKKITTDGLIFHFDMENTTKSFKGKPTTNIISSESILGMGGISYFFVEMDKGWKKYSISGTWNNNNYPWSCRINSAVFTGGSYYSSRFLVKTNVRHKFATWPDTNKGIHYVNDGNMQASGTRSSVSLGLDEDGLEIIENYVNGFAYSTGFANPTTSQVGYFHSRPLENGTTFDSSTDFVWVKEIQVEAGTFTTPYVSGTRSNTDAIKDLSGLNKTITPINLTYDSDNTFQFDETDDYMTCGNFLPKDAYTKIAWFKPFSSTNNIISGNGSFQHAFWMNSTDTHLRAGHNGAWSTVSYSPGNMLNQWWHGAVTFNTTTGWVLYLNGEVVDTDSSTTTWNGTEPGLVQIGAYNVGNYFHGEIPVAQVYDRVLTPSEIRKNFIATKDRFGL